MTWMMQFVGETWSVMVDLSPWLLLGMVLAGVLHVALPEGTVRRHMSGRRFASVFKAVAVGVPLPLCSCGVIPTAIGLKKDGASNGAATGFLISTPQTGVDSILVSATFLGWPFAIFKVLAALVSGIVGGLVVNAVDGDDDEPAAKPAPCCAAGAAAEARPWWREMLSFGLIDLLKDVYRWVIVGVLAAALISTLLPADRLVSVWWTQGLIGMAAMLLISLPMYVCATASVPMAASLVMAGMSPGAALVLLMAGPTTNLATMGAILRTFGGRVLAVYLSTVAVFSVGAGMLFDGLLTGIPTAAEHMHGLPSLLSHGSAVVLVGMLAWHGMADIRKRLASKPAAACCSHSGSDAAEAKAPAAAD